MRVCRDDPNNESLRQTFLQEHQHQEDEVRFFVEGCGLFSLHIDDEEIQVSCQAHDWIMIPAGTRHWFDMGTNPSYCVIRFFNNSEGWLATAPLIRSPMTIQAWTEPGSRRTKTGQSGIRFHRRQSAGSSESNDD